MSVRPKRRKFVVKWAKEFKQWELWEGDDLVEENKLKDTLVSIARTVAKDAEPSQLVIKGKNGRIQSERTYPRSSDPKRRKG